MSRKDWLACQNVNQAIQTVRWKSERKQRLFALEVARRWPDITATEIGRRSLEWAEAMADNPHAVTIDGKIRELLFMENLTLMNPLLARLWDMGRFLDHALVNIEDEVCIPIAKEVVYGSTYDENMMLFPVTGNRAAVPDWRARCPEGYGIAEQMDEEGKWNLMGVLHDALEDAGAPSEMIEHASEAWHCRGCWLVDILLGKL